MTTRFMGGTLLASAEEEMQRIPGFRPRGSGLIISRYTCTKPCDRLSHSTTAENQRNCQSAGRTHTQQCFVEGCDGVSKLLDKLSAEVGVQPFVARITRLSEELQTFFLNSRHRERFLREWETRLPMKEENAWCAALYLLSWDSFLWFKAMGGIKPDLIDFNRIPIHGVDLNGYVLFHTARDLYKGTKHISLSELTDPELVSDQVFRLIIGGFLIRRYGSEVIWKDRGMKDV